MRTPATATLQRALERGLRTTARGCALSLETGGITAVIAASAM